MKNKEDGPPLTGGPTRQDWEAQAEEARNALLKNQERMISVANVYQSLPHSSRKTFAMLAPVPNGQSEDFYAGMHLAAAELETVLIEMQLLQTPIHQRVSQIVVRSAYKWAQKSQINIDVTPVPVDEEFIEDPAPISPDGPIIDGH